MALKAFIPAAGLGTRLLPVTNAFPKPLLPILGRPILDYVLDKIMDLPVEKAGINLHHIGDRIRDWIKAAGYGDFVEFFPEDPILGTGGALYNARDFLKSSTFIVHNGDVISDIDMVAFHEFHVERLNRVTLAVCDCAEFNAVGVDEMGLMVSVGDKGRPDLAKRKVTFTGIALYEPGFLKYLPAGVSHVTDSWLRAFAEGERIGVFDMAGSEWNDLGTVDRYAARILSELDKRSETRFIGNNVYVPIDCRMAGTVVVESDSRIGLGVEMENTIVLPGGVVHGGEKLKRCLVSGSDRIPLKSPKHDKAEPREAFKAGGSNRIYMRVQLADDISGFLLKSGPDDPDFERQVEFTHFFTRQKLPVPRLLSCDMRRRRAMFEYLGDTDLYNWFRSGPNNGEKLTMYKEVLDQLVRFQQVRTAGNTLLRSRVFDMETLLWETRYFLDRFVKGFLNLSPDDEGELKEEFRKLAEKVFAYPKRLMHRDFQSCNIMVFERKVYLIDYQGARVGPPAYDAVSCIQDPYCPLPVEMEEELKDHYFREFMKRDRYSEARLKESFLYCALQRHMQALGAYGYLTRIKGKAWFEQHIPRGLELLRRDAAAAQGEFPAVNKLVQSLKLKEK